MRKLFLLVAVLAVTLVFYSCEQVSTTETPEGTTGESENPAELLEQAQQALQNGDVSSAEELFERILKDNPDDPQANAGISVIYTFKSLEEIVKLVDEHYGTVEDILKNLSTESGNYRETLMRVLKSVALRKFLDVFRSEETPSPTEVIEEIFSEIESIQEDLDEDVIPKLENVINHARKVVNYEGNFEMKIYPNNFDWDGDGTVENDKSLKFKITFVDGSVQYFDMEQFYEGNMPDFEKQVEMVEIDKSGGDAWFDYDSLKCEVSDCDDYEIGFDENDYITIDKGDMYALLWAAEYMISYLYAVNIYNFRIPQETVEVVYQAVVTNDPTSLLNYFNPDGDATITNEEISSKLGGFLTFRSNGEDYLMGLYDAQVNLRKDLVSLVEDIASDEDGIEEHNITSEDFIGDIDESQLESFREEKQKEIDFLTKPFEIPDSTPPATLHVYVVKEHPERFADLKVFLPDVGIESGMASFPDPTFGGILESEWDGNIPLDQLMNF